MSAEQATAPASERRRIVRVKAIATLLDLAEKKVYELVRADLIPHIRVGRSVRFDLARVEKWLDGGGTGYGKQSATVGAVATARRAAKAERFRDELDEFGEWQSVWHQLRGNEITVLEGRLSGESLRAIGERMGLTTERIRQIQNKSLRKIKYRIYARRQPNPPQAS